MLEKAASEVMYPIPKYNDFCNKNETRHIQAFLTPKTGVVI